MFQITYSKKAEKFLRKQDKATQHRLFTAISKLPLEGDIKKMQGVSGYRLRVGTYLMLMVLLLISLTLVIVDKSIKECENHV